MRLIAIGDSPISKKAAVTAATRESITENQQNAYAAERRIPINPPQCLFAKAIQQGLGLLASTQGWRFKTIFASVNQIVRFHRWDLGLDLLL